MNLEGAHHRCWHDLLVSTLHHTKHPSMTSHHQQLLAWVFFTTCLAVHAAQINPCINNECMNLMYADADRVGNPIIYSTFYTTVGNNGSFAATAFLTVNVASNAVDWLFDAMSMLRITSATKLLPLSASPHGHPLSRSSSSSSFSASQQPEKVLPKVQTGPATLCDDYECYLCFGMTRQDERDCNTTRIEVDPMYDVADTATIVFMPYVKATVQGVSRNMTCDTLVTSCIQPSGSSDCVNVFNYCVKYTASSSVNADRRTSALKVLRATQYRHTLLLNEFH